MAEQELAERRARTLARWSDAELQALHTLITDIMQEALPAAPTFLPEAERFAYWSGQTVQELSRHLATRQRAEVASLASEPNGTQLPDYVEHLFTPDQWDAWASAKVAWFRRVLARELEQRLPVGLHGDIYYLKTYGWSWALGQRAVSLAEDEVFLGPFLGLLKAARAGIYAPHLEEADYFLADVSQGLKHAWRRRIDAGDDPLTVVFTTSYVYRAARNAMLSRLDNLNDHGRLVPWPSTTDSEGRSRSHDSEPADLVDMLASLDVERLTIIVEEKAGLTDRQKTILRMFAQGYSRQEIAAYLSIATDPVDPNTVSQHRFQACEAIKVWLGWDAVYGLLLDDPEQRKRIDEIHEEVLHRAGLSEPARAVFLLLSEDTPVREIAARRDLSLSQCRATIRKLCAQLHSWIRDGRPHLEAR